jgi:hypothetical protein
LFVPLSAIEVACHCSESINIFFVIAKREIVRECASATPDRAVIVAEAGFVVPASRMLTAGAVTATCAAVLNEGATRQSQWHCLSDFFHLKNRAVRMN